MTKTRPSLETNIFIDKNAEIVRRCQNGDRKAQFELYKSYAKSMFNVCMRILNDPAEAEDALQESFVSAFQHLHRFKGDSTFGAWLKQIVVNQSISQLRSRKVQWIDIEEAQAEVEDTSYNADDFQEEYAQTEMNVAAVQGALQDLSEGYRVVLTLYLFEGYDHEEIAQILGISESTSRTQYMRAKKKLLTCLKLK